MEQSFVSRWHRWGYIAAATIALVALAIWPPVAPQWHMAIRIAVGIIFYAAVVVLDWCDAVKTFDLDDPHMSPRCRETLQANTWHRAQPSTTASRASQDAPAIVAHNFVKRET